MIHRDPQSAAGQTYDLAIIGGGIYGIALCLEAARRGWATLLVEREDFGSQTSWNSLRILHGGLRYLQTLDVGRFRDSVTARTWWMQTYPELVRPLPCIMPLYSDGLRRPSILRLALWANDLLSHRRNRGVRADLHLDRGRVLPANDLQQRFPSFDLSGARGAALWYDAMMPSSERVLMEMLRWATACGATCLNYSEAKKVLRQGSLVAGVAARDRVGDCELEFRARSVVSCAGPWIGELETGLDRGPSLLFFPSLAINLLLDRDCLTDTALAITAQEPGSKALFLSPWKDRILAGTYHAPLPDGSPETLRRVLERSLEEFLDQLNAAAPDLQLSRGDVLWVQHGRLPVKTPGSTELTTRPIVRHQADLGGPAGLFLVSGVKFTTARQVALATLARIQEYLGGAPVATRIIERPEIRRIPTWEELDSQRSSDPEAARLWLRQIAEEESVVAVEDLLLRRTDWWSRPEDLPTRSTIVRDLLDLPESQAT